ncbi:MAG: sulfatase-like hydrolase/transferase, partial [Bacteroidetes bacterium]|nr:sulfatase-like hydrolase/transferase [Bacteroidota bacterium]
LMLINLLDVDVAGHANDWNRYIHAIQYTDSCALKIWKTIQSNPKMKDKTTLFITNDHGRHKEGHKNGFVSHGDYCSGCRKISLLAIGPDFTKNTVVHSKHQIVDIAPTIAELLQFPLPKSKGKSLLPVLIK